MKQFIKFFMPALFFINSSCSAQKLMRTVEDAPKIKENKARFIGKSLKTLLKEIGPEIKMVSANPSKSNATRLGYFIFRFVEPKKNDSLVSKNKFPLRITVFVKEPFEWDLNKRQPEKKLLWTKDDAVKYADLTIVDIRVFGE
jgi:hypothetical protein